MVLNDMRFALRTLAKSPAFAVTAVLTIALGIGASTAIFSVVNGLLLRPLPYAHPDRLVLIQSDLRARHVLDFPIAPGNLPDIRARASAFQDIAAISSGPFTYVADDGKSEQIEGASATTNLFTVLGAHIAIGRNFVEADGTAPAKPAGAPTAAIASASPPPPPSIAILSHAFWTRRFAADSGVIGRTIQLNGAPAQVVGITDDATRFVFPTGSGVSDQPDVVVAYRLDWNSASRIDVFLRLVGRLAPGATISAAQAQLNGLAADLSQRFPIFKSAGLAFRAEPMQADIVRPVRPVVLALMGAVTFVLLIACANVANLLLVRASSRERELAVRAALGGSRAALVSRMFAESATIALGGALLGLLFAKLGIRLLTAIAPRTLPLLGDVSIDGTVLGFTMLLGALSALVFGMLPAWRASRPDLAQTLRAGGRSPSLQSGKMLRQGVVVVEVALSFVLLVASGLMVRSFVALTRVDPGFNANGLLTFNAANPRLKTPAERRAWEATMLTRLRAIRGAEAVTAAIPLPLDGFDANMRWGTNAAENDPSQFQQATLHIVEPGFFDAMQAKLIAGRALGDADNDSTSRAIVIDDLLAAKAFPNESLQSIIGKQLFCRITTPDAQMYQVVGIVKHIRHLTLAEPGREAVFVTDGLVGFAAATHWAIRTTGDPMRLVPDVRRVVADIDQQVPVANAKPMSAFIDGAMAPTRFALVLIGVFAAVAAVLACVGLYGVLATTVRQRTSEIGVRMAFGATSRSIFGLMIGQGLALSAFGIAFGVVAALNLTGIMAHANMLVSTAPTDPPTYAAIALLFVGIAALACWVPARRAAGLDPNVALRQE